MQQNVLHSTTNCESSQYKNILSPSTQFKVGNYGFANVQNMTQAPSTRNDNNLIVSTTNYLSSSLDVQPPEITSQNEDIRTRKMLQSSLNHQSDPLTIDKGVVGQQHNIRPNRYTQVGFVPLSNMTKEKKKMTLHLPDHLGQKHKVKQNELFKFNAKMATE